jgi:exopolysaccharide production protein ExoQ
MRFLDRREFRRWFSGFVLFTGLCGESWRNLIGWYGYGAVLALVIVGSSFLVIRNRSRVTLFQIPIPLIAFLLLATLSIAWSYYPLSSLLGVAIQWATTLAGVAIALSTSWAEFIVVLGWVLRAILGLSYIFELLVSIVFQKPIFPVWLSSDEENPSKLLYWSRALLFEGGKIQGIPGSSSLLAMLALIALIVFSVQLWSRKVHRSWGLFWVAVAMFTVVITQSATVYIAFVAVIIVAAAALLIRKASNARSRVMAYVGILFIFLGSALTATMFKSQLLALLGKSADFTGRFGIWDAVIALAGQRPIFGWGWVSYWPPWSPPFDHLIRRGGVQVLQAHDAWLDVWLQLGIFGLAVFGGFVLTTLLKSWQLATDRIITTPNNVGKYSHFSLVPILVLSAQVVQSAAESRMLIEGGWMLLVIFAFKLKEGVRHGLT